MANKILSAVVHPVKIGNREIEGLLLENGEYAVAVTQLQSKYDFLTDTHFDQWGALCGFNNPIFSVDGVLALSLEDAGYLVDCMQLRSIKRNLLETGDLAESNQATLTTKHCNRKQSVYFILDEMTNTVKIGKAFYPETRLKQFQIGSPGRLRLLATTKNHHEKDLHHKFTHYKVRGEWFEYSEEIKHFISTL